ncbi:MAG: DUF551 domain-containing protein [Flavobacteriaceae bacterium]|nr:DUF551 domain-containing protein [Flavobacteriaceae bacterium]
MMSDWISVKDRLPETGKAVSVARFYQNGNRVVTRGFYAAKHTLDADNWEECEGADYEEAADRYWCPEGWYEEMTSEHCDYFYPIDGVTDWQPLPALPGVDNDD